MQISHIPLESATFSEVLARVAFRLVQIDYRRTNFYGRSYEDGIYAVARRLDQEGWPMPAMWITAALYQMHRRGITLGEWRTDVVQRARWAARNRSLGKPWKPVR
jgi:hypothetical protein